MSQDSTLHLLNSVQVEPPSKDVYVSASGVSFKMKRVSAFAIKDALAKIKDPSVPRFFNEGKGRDEDNPNDPDYVAAVQEADYQRSMMGINVAMGLGTAVIDYGDYEERPETDEWIEKLELIGIEVPKSGVARYMAWVRYSGVLSESELADMTTQIAKLSGLVKEEDVAIAAESFPGSEERNTTQGSITSQEDQHQLNSGAPER